nr:hypothetical protein B0A51_16533 [Rachicladosporium sp. CCFEE 5018]
MTERPQTFDDYIALADRYRTTAAWEEASRALDGAASSRRIKSKQQFIALNTRRGHIEWRKGNYQNAVALLIKALAVNGNVHNLTHVEIVGELGNIHIKIDFLKAHEMLVEALRGAEQLLKEAELQNDHDLCMNARLQACRSIGNLGITKYHIATTDPVRSQSLLEEAIDHLGKRVQWAEDLQHQLEHHADLGGRCSSVGALRTFGLGRLALCYVALQQPERALQHVQAAVQSASQSTEPLIRGLTRFYHGYTLLAAGLPDQALREWELSSEADLCSPVIALCKEPTEEHCRWLRTMRSLKARFDRYDEVGYTALDYAVLAGHGDCISIVTRGIRDELDALYPDDEAKADTQLAIKVAESHRRKQYREMLQLTLRPVLANPPSVLPWASPLLGLRLQYAHTLRTDLRKRESFDKFKIISYAAFKSLGSLPRPLNAVDMAALQRHIREESAVSFFPTYPHIVFFSYEWRGRRTGRPSEPDDDSRTQYTRMIDAIELLLLGGPEVTGPTIRTLAEKDVYIWLDVASIDQNNQDPGAQNRGISALPLMISLCNTMISLVDDSYFSRAWCAVEALLMQSLLSYGHHNHLEHRPAQTVPSEQSPPGTLVPLRRLEQLQDVATNDLKYGISKPEDRASIRFLARQAKLLEKI